MYCQNCGKEVEEKDRFCKNCGVLLGYTREEETPVQQEPGPEQKMFPEETEGSDVQADHGFQEEQQFVSFGLEVPQTESSRKKTTTWIIVGAVVLAGLMILIVLAVLLGVARRQAKPRLRQWQERIQEEYEEYDEYDDFGFGFDYDDDEEDYFDDGEDYFEHGGEQFF